MENFILMFANAYIQSMHLCFALFVLLLFYAIATVFKLDFDGDMMYEMRRRKREPTLLLTQAIFKLPIPCSNCIRGTGLL